MELGWEESIKRFHPKRVLLLLEKGQKTEVRFGGKFLSGAAQESVPKKKSAATKKIDRVTGIVFPGKTLLVHF